MRLINAQTLKLEDFSGRERPPYAILSHTWGDDEVTFQHLQNLEDVSAKRGYVKIIGCCKQARRDGYEYVWIDTCCIDKSSSAELSEAINSMFQWYADSGVCYAYLVDFERVSERQTNVPSALQSSRWFRRGWTLQELLAPSKLILFASDWSKVGTRDGLAGEISTITKIDRIYLAGMRSRDPGSLFNHASVAERMSWASGRETTRVEDTAYSLLGLFGINMPLLYGEGHNAFRRLQEEIIKTTDDQTIFAWSLDPGSKWNSALTRKTGSLAASPSEFANSGNLVPWRWDGDNHIRASHAITNQGVDITLLKYGSYVALKCHPKNDPTKLVVRRVESLNGGQGTFYFDDTCLDKLRVSLNAYRWWKKTPMFLTIRPWESQSDGSWESELLLPQKQARHRIYIRSVPQGFVLKRLPNGGHSSFDQGENYFDILQPRLTGGPRAKQDYTIMLEEISHPKYQVYITFTVTFHGIKRSFSRNSGSTARVTLKHRLWGRDSATHRHNPPYQPQQHSPRRTSLSGFQDDLESMLSRAFLHLGGNKVIYVVTSKHKMLGNSTFIVDAVCSNDKFGVLWAQISKIRNIIEERTTTFGEFLLTVIIYFASWCTSIVITSSFSSKSILISLGERTLELSSWLSVFGISSLYPLFVADVLIAFPIFISTWQTWLVPYFCSFRNEAFTPPLLVKQKFGHKWVTGSVFGLFILCSSIDYSRNTLGSTVLVLSFLALGSHSVFGGMVWVTSLSLFLSDLVLRTEDLIRSN